MAIINKQITKRPSINDLFYFEGWADRDVYEAVPIINITTYGKCTLVGLIDEHVENQISWQEILDRRSELRPDQRVKLTESYLTNKINSANNNCFFNPFLETHTKLYTFDTWENFLTSYQIISSFFLVPDDGNYYSRIDELVISAKRFNNNISEFIYVDGIETAFPSDMPSIYNGKF